MDEMIDVLDSLHKYVPTVSDVSDPPGSQSTQDEGHQFFTIGLGTYVIAPGIF